MEKWTIKNAALALKNRLIQIRIDEKNWFNKTKAISDFFDAKYTLNDGYAVNYLTSDGEFIFQREKPMQDIKIILLSEIQPDESEFENGETIEASMDGENWKTYTYGCINPEFKEVHAVFNKDGYCSNYKFVRKPLAEPSQSTAPATITITTTYPVEIVVNGKCLEM